METIGERIRRYREAAGLTQEELAAKIQTSAQNIYKYEKGVIQNIPMKKIQALSDIFGISPTQLVGWGIDPYAQYRQPFQKKPVEITTLSEDEKELIVLYRQGSPEYRTSLINLLKAKNQHEYETGHEPEKAFTPFALKLAAPPMPEYKFSGKKTDK